MTRHWFTSYLTNNYSQKKNLGLDIGCGKQPYKELFNCDYVGIDIPSDSVKNKKEKPNCFAIGENLPFQDNVFDFITSFSVIPYVENIDNFLNEMYRVCKNNAVIVISIMNLKALSRDPKGHYPNKFSSKQLEKKLSQHGFKSIKSKNLKALIWSNYFNLTSVYSYAIVECIKNKSKPMKKNQTSITKRALFRQLTRSKLLNRPKLYLFSKNLYRKYCSMTQSFHVFPTFLIIGAAKCGTSSLYDYLMQHPCVGRSLTKQLHFFDRYYDRKISWYKVCFPFVWQKFFIEKLKHQNFATGEATAHYMTHPLAAKRAYKVIPNVKIIVMLRNPVDRAYSHYQMEKDHKNEELTFEEAIEIEPKRIKGEIEEMQNNQNNSGRNYPHRAYVKSGEYLDQIKTWMELYPKENFMFIKSEDFNENPSVVYNDVLKFLELSPFKLDRYEKIRKRKYEKMNVDVRKKLLKYYRSHNQHLSDFLGISFNWND